MRAFEASTRWDRLWEREWVESPGLGGVLGAISGPERVRGRPGGGPGAGRRIEWVNSGRVSQNTRGKYAPYV